MALPTNFLVGTKNKRMLSIKYISDILVVNGNEDQHVRYTDNRETRRTSTP